MENAGYLFAAYTIIWVVLFGFVFMTINRQSRLRREVENLRQMVKDKETPPRRPARE